MDDTVLLTTEHLPALIAGAILLAATIAAFRAATRGGPAVPGRLARRLGLSEVPAPVVWVFGGLWAALLTAFVLGILWVFYAGLTQLPDLAGTDEGDLRWYLLTLKALTAALGAVVALPFTLLRTAFNARQTRAAEEQSRTAEENLTTDLINKAVEGLGAEKEVNRLGRNIGWRTDDADHYEFEWRDDRVAIPEGSHPDPDLTGEWKNITLTEPNLEVRIGAIYVLKRVAEDSPRDRTEIMKILDTYVRNNSSYQDR